MTNLTPEEVEKWGFAGDIISDTFPKLAAKHGLGDGTPSFGGEASGAFARLFALIATYREVAKEGFTPSLRAMQQIANLETPNALPGVSDLVRMELREVFREEDRAAQLTPRPTDTFLELMKRQGYDTFHAESYWAAHWDLPSVQQGFEMLHRLRPGRVDDELVFTVEDLRTLLKKQDVLPAYVDRVIATSYQPLTRVDVRRMYQLNVLDLDDVVEAYRDLGYDETNAQRLADFVKADVATEARELSRGDWIASFREGLVSEAQLTAALKDMGYSDESAGFVVALELARKDAQLRREREAFARNLEKMGRRVRRQSRADKLDEDATRAELEDLGLSDLDISLFFTQYRMTPMPKAKDLTRGDELAAFRFGIVTEDETRERLAALGLDEREVGQLVAIEKAKMKKPEKGGRDLGKSDIVSLLKKRVMSPDEAADRLADLGYSKQDAEALVLANAPA